MSEKALEEIVSRAVGDAQFREQLIADPAAACAGYDVTPEEIASLAEQFSGRSEELGARISKRKMSSDFGGFSGPMGIEDAVE